VAKIVNGVVKSYITLIVEAEQKERRTRLDELKKLWSKYGDSLDLKRKALRELASSVGFERPAGPGARTAIQDRAPGHGASRADAGAVRVHEGAGRTLSA